MTKVSEILIPPQMRPELANALAGMLSWAPENSDVVSFTALALLNTSWHMSTPFTLADALAFLREKTFAKGTRTAMAVLRGVEVYQNPTHANRIGPMVTVQAQQSALYWGDKLRKAEAGKLIAYLDATLESALQDTTPQSLNLADEMENAIENLHPCFEVASSTGSFNGFIPNEEQGGDPIKPRSIVMSPDGRPMAMFSSPAEALGFLMQQMGAQAGRPYGRDAKREQDLRTTEQATPQGPGLQVFPPSEALSTLQRLPPPLPGEGNAQQRRVLESMANDTGWRPLTVVPEGNPLAPMYQRFPHFKEVLDFIAKSLALAACGEEGKPLRVPPILLRSKPGVGKTYFAQELARIMNAEFVERDMSVTSEAFVLSGMDASWKNSKPGVVFNSVVNGKTANPVICLNEVDKCSTTGTHNSPMSALHALLEPTSAERFADEFIPFPIDASGVVWILTANEGQIPEPILSRLEVFDVPEPTKEECRLIAASVWSSICERTLPRGHRFAAELSGPLLEFMSSMSPRIMRKALTHAASTAALDGRNHMELSDLTTSQKRYATPRPRTIGFVNAAEMAA